MPRVEDDPAARAGLAIVLGGGGATGAASICGNLRALSEVAGIGVDAARVVIGTSAGAAVGAEMRLGHTVDELAAGLLSDDPNDTSTSMRAAWKSKPEFLRRLVGSSYIVAQTAVPGAFRMAKPLPLVQRAFPGSLVSIPHEMWEARFPAEWPRGELWLVASDLDNGERIVLSGDRFDGVPVSLVRAVQASCAVPGVFPPVRIGKRRLIDGGVHSATNLDLAVRTNCRAVIALAPMSFDRRDPPGFTRTVGRLRFNTKLDQEAAKVRRAGMVLLNLRPGADEVRHHGFNMMSRRGFQDIMEAAYEATVRRLTTGHYQQVLEQIRGEALADTA